MKVRVKRTREGDRLDSWLRYKQAREKWPRFAAEVPPEIAEEIDEHRLHQVNQPSRAEIVRAGLRLYMEAEMPQGEEAIEGEASDAPPEIEG